MAHTSSTNANDYGEKDFTERQSSSKQSLIPCKPSKNACRRGLDGKSVELILSHWIRGDSSMSMMESVSMMHRSYGCIYVVSMEFALKHRRMSGVKWSNQKKASSVKLLNTNQTLMIHQNAFRSGRNQKRINFAELNKHHLVFLDEAVPDSMECNLC